MDVINYYTLEICKKIINNVKDSKWRIWKIKDIDERIIQSKRPIVNANDLYKFIHQAKNPQALYYSISTFLNPQLNHGFFYNQKIQLSDGSIVYPRAGYIISDCILLNTFYFIDLDHKSDLRLVQEDGRKIIKEFGNPEFLRFSGTKGIHLGYKQNIKSIQNPVKRIEYYKQQKQELTKRLLNLNLNTIDKIHENILNDIFRVIAAPYSIKGSGRVVQPLNIEDFMSEDIHSLLSLKPIRAKRKKLASESLEKDDDGQGSYAKVEPLASHLYQADERFSSLSSQPTFFRFVDNMVKGLKNNYVTVIKKHKKRFSINKLKEIQKLYNLSDFNMYIMGNYIYAYNSKVNQFAREVKILRRAKSENLSFFLTRGHTPLPISETRNKHNQVVDKLEYIGTLKSKYGLKHDHSLPHCKLFNLNYSNMVGNKNIRIGTMRVS